MSIDEDISALEALVNEYESDIESGKFSIETILNQFKQFSNMPIETQAVKGNEIIKALMNKCNKIDLGRLKELKWQNPNDSHVSKIVSKAASCYLKMFSIAISASEEFFDTTPGVREDIHSKNQEMINTHEEILSELISPEEKQESAKKFFENYLERVKEFFKHNYIAYKKSGMQYNNNVIAKSARMVQIAKPMGLQIRAMAYIGNGDLNNAIANCSAAIQDMPDAAWLYETRGAAYGEKGDYYSAIADFDSAIRIKSDSGDSYYYRSLAHLGKGDFDRAFSDCNKALELESIFDYNKLDAYLLRGFLYGRNRDFNKAIADFESALRIKLKKVSEYNIDIEPEFYENARKYLKHIKEFEALDKTILKTIEDLTGKIRLNPENDELYVQRGISYTQRGDNDLALNDFNKAIQLNPNCANVYAMRGTIYRIKGEYNKSIEDCEKALQIDPNDKTASLVLMESKKLKKQVEEQERIKKEKAEAEAKIEAEKKAEAERKAEEARLQEEYARKAKPGYLLQTGLMLCFFGLLYFTNIISSYDGALAAMRDFGILSLIFGFISLILCKKGNGMVGLLFLIIMIIVASITYCVSESTGFFTTIFNFVFIVIILLVSAIPGAALIIYAEEPKSKEITKTGKIISIVVCCLLAAFLALFLVEQITSTPQQSIQDEPKKAEAAPQITATKGSFTDPRDSKTYKTVKINAQTWLAENLNYNAKGSKCYDNKSENCQKYGRYYTWAAAMKVCPAGWHLPSNAEWDKLYRSIDGSSGAESPYKSETAGKHLKAASGWKDFQGVSGNGADKYGFAFLPGGSGNSNGKFFHLAGETGYWWSSSANAEANAYYRFMTYENGQAGFSNYVSKEHFLNVRCLQD